MPENYEELNVKIYREEIKIEEDCGVFFIIDMYGNIIEECDTMGQAKDCFYDLTGEIYDRKIEHTA